MTTTQHEIRAYVGSDAAKVLERLDPAAGRAIASELKALKTLEAANKLPPMQGLPDGYRAVALPSGYMAVYRPLSEHEVKEVTGELIGSDVDAYLVADLVPLISLADPSVPARA